MDHDIAECFHCHDWLSSTKLLDWCTPVDWGWSCQNSSPIFILRIESGLVCSGTTTEPTDLLCVEFTLDKYWFSKFSNASSFASEVAVCCSSAFFFAFNSASWCSRFLMTLLFLLQSSSLCKQWGFLHLSFEVYWGSTGGHFAYSVWPTPSTLTTKSEGHHGYTICRLHLCITVSSLICTLLDCLNPCFQLLHKSVNVS